MPRVNATKNMAKNIGKSFFSRDLLEKMGFFVFIVQAKSILFLNFWRKMRSKMY